MVTVIWSPSGGCMVALCCPSCREWFDFDQASAAGGVSCPRGRATIPAPRPDTDRAPPSGAPATECSPAFDLSQDTEGRAPRPDPSLTAFLAPSQAEDELGRLGKYR